MSKDATKIFSGPILDVLVGDSGSYALSGSDDTSFTSSGLVGTCNITFESNTVEVSEGHVVKLPGTGKFECELKQTAQSDLDPIVSGSTTLKDVIFRDIKGNDVAVSGVYLTYNLNRSFAVGEAHGLTFMGQRVSCDADDFVTFN